MKGFKFRTLLVVFKRCQGSEGVSDASGAARASLLLVPACALCGDSVSTCCDVMQLLIMPKYPGKCTLLFVDFKGVFTCAPAYS